MRLSKIRKQSKKRLDDQSVREARLPQMREHARRVRGEETVESRESRLKQMREHAQSTRSEETLEARASRLEQMRDHAQNAHREEGRESRAARLQQMRTHARAITGSGNGFQSINETCPVFGDNSTKKKVANFHSKLANCTYFECSTCLESFPALKAPHSNECTRCSHDKMKKFSCSNNMDPGPVPPELQGRALLR